MFRLVATQQTEIYELRLGLVTLIRLAAQDGDRIAVIRALRQISPTELRRAKLLVDAVLAKETDRPASSEDFVRVTIHLPEKAEPRF